MTTKKNKKGRPTLFGKRLKDNGLSVELDEWLHAEAERRDMLYSELKRVALEKFRQDCEKDNGKA